MPKTGDEPTRPTSADYIRAARAEVEVGALLDLVKRYDNALFRTANAQEGEKQGGPSKYSL